MNNIEITVNPFRSAEENKKIAREEIARKAEIERVAREAREAEERKKAYELLASIVVEINDAAEKGCTHKSINWTMNPQLDEIVSYYQWTKYSKYFVPVLKEQGYKIYEYIYTPSWQSKSGKIGYITICW